jgi:hypothetical protein
MTTKLFYTATVVATMFSAAVPAMAARCPPGLLAGVYCQMDNMVAESQIWQRKYAHAKELCENGDENACDVADDMAEQAERNWQNAMKQRGW